MNTSILRCFVSAIAFLGFCSFLSFAPSTAGAQNQSSDAPRPNIIYIMADDLGYGDLGCYGQEFIRTPNIDRLAQEGLRFTQAYAGACVCAPSRCALMTGYHGGHAAVRDNIPHYPAYLEESHITVAEVLKQAGYRCGGVGKWSMGDPGTMGRATNQGFDMWFGYLNQDHAHYYYPEYLDDNEGRLDLAGNTETHEHYSHDLLTDRALKYIDESKDGPFFLYAAFTVPHFGSKKEDPTAFPVPSDAPYSDQPWTQAEKNYAAMVTLLDQDVGRIVDLVDRLGLTEKTLIIFTSDNGAWDKAPARFKSNGPLRGAKSSLYEGGMREPFVARWPGTVPEGSTSEEVIAFWDMMPTFAELAGVDAPEGIDGISVVSALKGGKLETPHEYLYWDYGHCRKQYSQAVRMGDWKGIRLGQGEPIALYDLAQDLGETTDVAAQHADVVKRIAEIMEEAVTPSERYPVGEIYTGKPIWRAPLGYPDKATK